MAMEESFGSVGSIIKKIQIETPPDASSVDSFANQEEAALSAGRLNEHKRGDSLRAHVHRVTVCIIWAFGCAFAILGLASLWHMVTPEKVAFLSAAQLQQINT